MKIADIKKCRAIHVSGYGRHTRATTQFKGEVGPGRTLNIGASALKAKIRVERERRREEKRQAKRDAKS